MRIVKTVSLLFFSLIFCFAKYAFAAQENLKYYEDQVIIRTGQSREIQLQIDDLKQDNDKINSRYELANKNNQNKKVSYERAKEAYNRASQNADIVTPDQMAQLLKAHQQTSAELKESNEALAKAKNEKNYIEERLQRELNKKNQKEIEILQIKAEMYDLKAREPVWVEGEGESILDENKSMKECEKLALEYARRDATEKGGKALIQSVTKVQMFELVQDDIKNSSKIKIIEQDNSGDYGVAKKIMKGDIIKYVAKVRLKIQSADDYNPYRVEINRATGEKIVDSKKSKDPSRGREQNNISSLSGVWKSLWPCATNKKITCESYFVPDVSQNTVTETVFWSDDYGDYDHIVIQSGSYKKIGNNKYLIKYEHAKAAFGNSTYNPDIRELILKGNTLNGLTGDTKKEVAAPFNANNVVSGELKNELNSSAWIGAIYDLSLLKLNVKNSSIATLTLSKNSGKSKAVVQGQISNLGDKFIFHGDVIDSSGFHDYLPDTLIFSFSSDGFHIEGDAKDGTNVKSFRAVRSSNISQ
jgi:hypothetical protein